MRTYETTVLIPAGKIREDAEGAVAAVRGLYESEGAEFIEFEKWEERRLTYPIEGEKAAVFFIGYLRAEPAAILAIEEKARLSDVILRQLIIKRDGNDYERIVDQRAKAAERREEAAAAEVD
jgi:small subunit ribosomal protein S6